MTQTLDKQMIDRYSECIHSHPNGAILVNDQPAIDFERAMRGELTHMLYSKGPLLIVRWIPTQAVKFLFDAYGQ